MSASCTTCCNGKLKIANLLFNLSHLCCTATEIRQHFEVKFLLKKVNKECIKELLLYSVS